MASLRVFEKKLKKAFRFFDLNKTGYLSRKNIVQFADTLSSLSHSTEAERLSTRKQWTKWCDMIFPEGLILLEPYLMRNKMIIASDRAEKYEEETFSTFSNLFDRMDSKKDGTICPDELRMFYEAFGYGEEYDTDKVFDMLDEHDEGVIHREEFLHAGVAYWSNEPGYELLFDPPKKKKT